MRVHAIDTAKGIGIVLVVFGHAWRGGVAGGLDISAPLFAAIDNAIYSFHMPLFFFLAALLFRETLKRRSFSAIISERAIRLLWPMTLWTWIFCSVKLLAGTAANDTMTLAEFRFFPLPPYEHLWFLWALFLVQGIVAAIFATGIWTERKFRATMGAGAFALLLVLPFIFVPSLWLGAAVSHLPYFLAGLALGGYVSFQFSTAMAFVAAAIAGALILAAGHAPAAGAQSLAIVMALCVVISVLDRGRDVPGPFIRACRTLGNASLAIYLMHTIFSAGSREMLWRLGVSDVAVHLIGTTLAGVILPLVVWRMSRGTRTGRVLGF